MLLSSNAFAATNSILPPPNLDASGGSYGCTAVLCFASPNPMGIPECVATVRRVFRDLWKGRGFPTCGMVSASDQLQTNFKNTWGWKDCPDGMKAYDLGTGMHYTGGQVYKVVRPDEDDEFAHFNVPDKRGAHCVKGEPVRRRYSNCSVDIRIEDDDDCFPRYWNKYTYQHIEPRKRDGLPYQVDIKSPHNGQSHVYRFNTDGKVSHETK